MTKNVSGTPTFIAAYGVAEIEKALPFDLALRLAELVVEHNGGPVPIGRAFPKRLANALQKAGVIDVHTDYPATFGHKIHHGYNSDWTPRVSASVWLSAEPGKTERYVTATPESMALIQRHLPSDL